MSIGQGSVGEHAISELPSSSLDLAVGGIGVLNLVAIAPEVDAGVLISMPATAVSLVTITPAVAAGSLIDVPIGSVALSSIAPQVMQSVNLLVNTGVMQLIGVEPNLGAGVFIDNPSRQDSYVSLAGSIGSASIAEFGIGEGAPEVSLSGRRTARLPLKAGGVVILAGKTIDIPVGSSALIARVPELSARGRRLRSQAILS